MIRTMFCALTALTIVTALSCKKGTDNKLTPTPIDSTLPVTYDDYTALKPGNYWVYEDYLLDSANGEAHSLGTYDSNFVEKDTVINNRTYHKYFDAVYAFGTPAGYNISLLRDSFSYTVDLSGVIRFSSKDFTTIFRSYTFGPNTATPDTLYITEQMGFKDSVITVPAGTFTTATFRRIYRFPENNPYGRTRDYDFMYAKNIGLISNTSSFYSSSPKVYERRLIRYHVQ